MQLIIKDTALAGVSRNLWAWHLPLPTEEQAAPGRGLPFTTCIDIQRDAHSCLGETTCWWRFRSTGDGSWWLSGDGLSQQRRGLALSPGSTSPGWGQWHVAELSRSWLAGSSTVMHRNTWLRCPPGSLQPRDPAASTRAGSASIAFACGFG